MQDEEFEDFEDTDECVISSSKNQAKQGENGMQNNK